MSGGMSGGMRLYYDCEFFEQGPEHPLHLISIGIVSQFGREYYAQAVEFEWAMVPAGGTTGITRTENHWLRDNVLPHIRQCASGFNQAEHRTHYPGNCQTPGCPWRSRRRLAEEIRAFVGTAKPEWVGYCASYDHVLLCQIFGRMIDLPDGWPRYTLDLKQACRERGDPRLPRQTGVEHDALADARWIKRSWEYLMGGAVQCREGGTGE